MGDIFGVIFVRPLGLILMAIFSFVKNYGIALVIFTLIVKLILLLVHEQIGRAHV